MDPIIIVFVFLFVVFILAVVRIANIFSQRAKFNREAPYALSANAVVIAKRSQIQIIQEISYTYNFATFEIEGVGRIEFNVGNAFGLIVEGDRGILRYLTDPFRFVRFDLAERSQQFQH